MPRRSLTAALLALAFASILNGRAYAGPPYTTEDPETPPLGAWEINVAYLQHEGTDPASFDTPGFEFNYGFTPTIQLGLEAAVATVDPLNGDPITGFGDAALTLKWRFVEEHGGRPQVAIDPEVTLPTGNASAGLGDEGSSWMLPITVQKSWGPWTNFDDAGWVIQDAAGTRDYFIYGAAVTRDLSKTVAIGAELFGNGPTEPDAPSDIGWQLGLTWEITERIAFIGTGGHGMQPGASSTAFLGFQLHLGPLPED